MNEQDSDTNNEDWLDLDEINKQNFELRDSDKDVTLGTRANDPFADDSDDTDEENGEERIGYGHSP
jgi:hypothetical protein